ncbi:MAG TPA: NmrA family NAD(P)-binding protein [Chitinophagaceae bacterium]|nr:NmrA family NAD(P)-binding protein [Chitinophagaceae bacterium]
MAYSTDAYKSNSFSDSVNKTVILAGATGDLGGRIANHLSASGAAIKALVRKGSSPHLELEQMNGVQTIEVDYNNKAELQKACAGGAVVVSALSGLDDVIIDLQTKLAEAAIKAGVPRFIPSDYCIDYKKLPVGNNRNLDLRRAFNEQLDKKNIKATSILNGMFTDLLTGQAPVILTGIKRVMYWGNASQSMDFTTIDNTAAYTAAAALDDTTPRYLNIAGEVATINDLKMAASDVYKQSFKLFRLGGLGAFKTMINLIKKIAPQKNEVFPAWQGMQYLHDMFTGLPKFTTLNNDRYPKIKWTRITEVLESARN